MAESLLDTVTSGVQPRPRKVVLYGVQGIGKSTWAAGAPSPIFLNLEDGLADIECNSFPVAKEFDEVMAQLASLYSGQHDYKTVVVDSFDWLEMLTWKDVCLKGGKDSIADFGFGKGYASAAGMIKRVLDALTSLRNVTGLNTIVIAHAKIEKFENPMLDSYDRYSPKLHKAASALMTEWADEVFFANYQTAVRKSKEKFGNERALPVSTGERVIYTYEQPGFIAKNRLALPATLPLEWAAYAEHFKTEKPKTTKKGK